MSLKYEEVIRQIEQIVGDIAMAKGQPAPKLKESSRFLGGDLPIDSLDLAGMLVQMEAATGRDPFKAGFINFRTVGELARLYVG
ncbi:MAG: hypothetical protein P0120_18800 [Nitrospira sp.]|nr:hypothetical protein [Nitrospira sp.]